MSKYFEGTCSVSHTPFVVQASVLELPPQAFDARGLVVHVERVPAVGVVEETHVDSSQGPLRARQHFEHLAVLHDLLLHRSVG